MPILQKTDPISATLFVEATGRLSWTERCEAIDKFRESFLSGNIKYALFDLRNLTGENDAKDEIEFGKRMVKAIGEFSHVRAAVVLSRQFRVSSSVVLRLQQGGFNMMDFETVEEAKAWLYAAAPDRPRRWA